MSDDLARLLERTLGAIRQECPPAWFEIVAAGAGLHVSVSLDGERFTIVGTDGDLRVERPASTATGVQIEGGIVAIRRLIMGDATLIDSIKHDELFVAGDPNDLVRTDRLVWLLVGGASRASGAAPLLDELLKNGPKPKKGDDRMSKPKEADRRSLPPSRIDCDIAIFGAGIAGLTAAHELAERNFKVVVIDPDIRPEAIRPGVEYDNPGIGGMAKSQWGFIPVENGGAPRAPVSTGEMRPTLPRPSWSAIEIDYSIVDGAVRFESTVRDRNTRVKRGDLKQELVALENYLRQTKETSGLALTVVYTATAVSDLDLLGAAFRKLHEPLFAFKVMKFGAPVAEHGTVVLDLNLFSLPGEHGFRFFPSFYRHIFDTLKRIPLSSPRNGPSTRNGTVFDNLVPTEEIGYVGRAGSRSVRVPRRPIRSMEEAREIVNGFLDEAEYTESDLAMLGTTFLKYLTSSRLRREREYENVSWYEFVEGGRFSPRAQFLHETAPGTLGGLFGSSADARTQGSIAVQLMKDSLDGGSTAGADMLLNGPTDIAWFAHWYRYLRTQNVDFIRGELEDLHPDGPRAVVYVDGAEREAEFLPAHGQVMDGKSRFIVALPLREATEQSRTLLNHMVDEGIGSSRARDFAQLLNFVGKDIDLDHELTRANPRGPLRHLSGVQYFFDQDVRLWRGHTQYLDAEYGLTAIAQPQFWREPEDLSTGYRSVLSVDIGIWAKPLRADPPSQQTEYAWQKSPTFLAKEVWRQIRAQHAGDYPPNSWPTLPEPYAYHVDENLVLEHGNIHFNRSPFLVNEKGRYRMRPGSSGLHDTEDRTILDYHVAFDRYVMAGTHMQTATRITSMEAACESGRRAVNALLRVLGVPGEQCQVWDPEDFEPVGFALLKKIDRELCDRNCPHPLDIIRQ